MSITLKLSGLFKRDALRSPISRISAALAFVSVLIVLLAVALPERELELYPHPNARFSFYSDRFQAGAVSWKNNQPSFLQCEVQLIRSHSSCHMELEWFDGDTQITHNLSRFSHIGLDIDFVGSEKNIQFTWKNILGRGFNPKSPQENIGQIRVNRSEEAAQRYDLDAFSVFRLWYAKQLKTEGANVAKRNRVSSMTFGLRDMWSLETRTIKLNGVRVYGRWLYLEPTLKIILGIWLAWILFIVLKKISDRHPNKIARLVADSEQATQEAERANRDKLRFLSVASHDLRQPMHNLGFLIEELKYFKETPVSKNLVQDFKRSHGYLIKLLDSLLDLSKIDAKLIVPEKRALPVNDIFLAIEKNYTSEAREKGLAINICQTKCSIYSDPQLLIRIIGNLMSNAIKFTHSGGITLSYQEDKNRNFSVIKICDTGIGISKENLDAVFEPFYQIQNHTREQESGLGLGLHIVKRLADVMDIGIKVDSSLNKGTCVELIIESSNVQVTKDDCEIATWEPDKSELEPNLTTTNKPSMVLSGLVIAVIENEQDTLESLSILLRNWGCITLAASNIAEAVEQIDGEEVHVILSDYWLDSNELGTQAIEAIRKINGSEIEAIIFTGNTAIKVDGNIPGNVQVLYKPVEPEVLKQKLVSMYNEIINKGTDADVD